MTSEAFFFSFFNGDEYLLWKYLAFWNTVYSSFLSPLPTVLYCMHNFYILDKAANERPSWCAKTARYAFLYAQVAALVVCMVLAGFFLDENAIKHFSEGSGQKFGRYY